MKSLRVLLIALGLMLASTTGWARPMQRWSLAELMEKADVVVLATPTASGDRENFAIASDAKPDVWVPVTTRFKVYTTVKGKLPTKKDEAQVVSIQHYRYNDRKGEVLVVDGPNFVQFNPDKQACFMVFLKREPDGSFTPMSGQYDPGQSFLRIGSYQNPNYIFQ